MQLPAINDTIVAVGSAWAAAPVGVVRLSGPDCHALLGEIGVAPPPGGFTPAAWSHARLALDANASVPVRVLWFRAPRSYTGQHAAELHLPGSLPLLRRVCELLIAHGARRALPGEFTARAYLNGKLASTDVARVLALIHADDAQAARRAARSAGPERAAALLAVSDELLDLLALIEAGIDFADEEDVRFITAPQVAARLAALRPRLAALLHRAAPQQPARPHVALAGLPNAGKSTLFNALLGRQRAIVSPVIGTTRDVLSAELTIGGVALILQDCAGLGHTPDELELAAHCAAEQAAAQADLVLWVHPAGAAWDEREAVACARIPASRRLLVLTKLDAASAEARMDGAPEFADRVAISAETGAGLPELRAVLARHLGERSVGADGADAAHLAAAGAALDRAAALAGADGPALNSGELVALELRLALDGLRHAASEPLTEAVLGRIFGQFCVGK
jgi:tRNA modification GTPase